MTQKSGPDTTSTDYEAMLPYWNMVETILGGAQAMRDAGEVYLPRFPNETVPDYEYRRANAKFTNIYADIVNNLAAKPFSEEVSLGDDATAQLKTLAEDIDGQGNNLHVFAANTFFSGINYAVDWIFVDFTKARQREDGRALTLEDERRQGLRPYWVHVPAKRMLAVYTATIEGREQFIHARMREDATVVDGYCEVTIERIRVLNRAPIYATLADGTITDVVIGYEPATYELWEKKARAGRRGGSQWERVDEGPVSIGVIALVPFITGRRKEGSWQFVPPMQDAAHLQIEHYQQETALKSIKELTAFPMLAGNGVQPEMEGGAPKAVSVGPRSVLYAPPHGETGNHGEWSFIEPTAASLKFLAEDVANTEKQLRELGRQPLTAQTGNLTVVTTAFAAQKGNTAIQAWALNLKDALEQAWALTCRWLKIAVEPSVSVFTDFDVGMHDDKGPDVLTNMRSSGPNGEPDLSRETLWHEMHRRGILSGDFDAEAERKRLEEELPDDDAADDVGGAMTPPGDPEERAA